MTWWQVDYIEQLALWKGQYFFLTRLVTYFEYRFSFPARNASTKTTYNPMVFHTALHLNKDLTSQAKKHDKRLILMEFTYLTMFHSILKQLT
jgi:hypothetical protein